MDLPQEALQKIEKIAELKVYSFFYFYKINDAKEFQVTKPDFYTLEDDYFVSKTSAVRALKSLVFKGVLERIHKGKYKMLL